MQVLNRLLSRGFLWAGILLLLATTAYISAGRLLTPMFNAYRIEVQDWLGEQLGQPLHLGRLHAGWHGLSPRFYAEEVRLGEAEQAIHIDRLHFRPDMLTSLLRREWSLAAVSLQGVELELRQEGGQWHLHGMELAAQSDEPTDWPRLLDQLQRIEHLSIVDARIAVRREDAAPFELRQAGFTLDRHHGRQRLQASMRLPDGQPVQLHATGNLAAGNWQRSSLQAYARMPASNWLQWLPLEWLAGMEPVLQLDTAAMPLQAWLEVGQGQLQQLTLQSPGGRIQGRLQERELDLQLGQLQAFARTEGGRQRFWMPQFNVRWLPGADMLNLPLQASRPAGQPFMEAPLEIRLAELELQPFMSALLHHVPLPQLAHDILAQLDFRGRLRNTRLQWTPGEPWQQQLEYDTNVADLDYSPWNHVPGATGISGRLFGSLAGGELHLDSNGFSLYLDQLFADAWHYHRANARLTWSLAENLDFTLTSPYLQVVGDEGHLAGDFVISLPAASEKESYMDLRVGMRDGDASRTPRYLPLVLREEQPELWRWLHDAIRGAHVHEGYFQYQGSLAENAPESARSISLFFDVSDAELAYQPGWPALQEGRGQVFVHDWGIQVELDSARVLDTRITDARAEVVYPATGHSTLHVDTRLDSSMADALHMVQRTPLAEQIPFMADWQGQGKLPAGLRLKIPFADAQPVQALVDLQLDNASLFLPEQDIRLDQLQGALQIDSLKGLTGKNLRGRFLEQPFTASLQPGANRQDWNSQLQAKGRMPVAALQKWLDHQQPLPFSGSFNYELDLLLAETGSQLAVTTDLQGVHVDLPTPLAKPAEAKVPTSWHMTLDGPELHYRLVHGTRLNGLFAVEQKPDKLLRGELVLGGSAARLPAKPGLWIRGTLASVPVPDWLEAVDNYLPVFGEGQGAGLQELQLDATRLEGFGIPIEQARLRLWPNSSKQDAWLLKLDSKQVEGAVQVSDGRPLVVTLERLQLPAPGSPADPLALGAQLKPEDVPSMNLRIRQLQLGEDVLGELGFDSRPAEDSIRFSRIAADFKGLLLNGELDWYKSGQSSFKGSLTGEKLEDILQAWGYARSMSSERFSTGLDIHWPGNPLDFSMAGLSGTAQLKFRKGQLTAADGSAQVLRVFGLLNFDTIGRRLRLDFSDLLGKGLSYDRIDGILDISSGVYRTRDALTLEGVSSNLSIEGMLDMPAGRVDAEMQLAMPITRNLPLAAVAVGAPAVGGALFVIDRLVGDRFARMAAVRYSIRGDWQDPQITLSKGGADK